MIGYKYEVGIIKGTTQYEWRISYRKKIIGYGTGYNTKQNAVRGIRAICRATGGDWDMVMKQVKTI